MLGEKYEKQDFFFTMCPSLGIILPNKISFQGHLLKFQLFVYSKSQNPMKMLILPTSINVFGFQLIIPLSLKTPDTDKHLIITILKQLLKKNANESDFFFLYLLQAMKEFAVSQCDI